MNQLCHSVREVFINKNFSVSEILITKTLIFLLILLTKQILQEKQYVTLPFLCLWAKYEPICGGGGWLAGVMGHFSDLSFRQVTTKTLAYFKKFGFFRKIVCQKIYPSPVKSFFENTIENPFFLLPEILTEILYNNLRIEIQAFSFRICFQNQFST